MAIFFMAQKDQRHLKGELVARLALLVVRVVRDMGKRKPLAGTGLHLGSGGSCPWEGRDQRNLTLQAVRRLAAILRFVLARHLPQPLPQLLLDPSRPLLRPHRD
jgi:hypothetical protein